MYTFEERGLVVDKPQELFTADVHRKWHSVGLQYSPNRKIRTPTQICGGDQQGFDNRCHVSTPWMIKRTDHLPVRLINISLEDGLMCATHPGFHAFQMVF